jgi:hypothetical protein
MSENETEDNYQAYAAGMPVEDTPALAEVVVEEPVTPASEPEPEPEPAPKAKPQERVEDTVATHVVGTGDQDEVHLDKCVYKNMYARKSLTVHHLQRRLTELGYGEASSDKDGWYGDLTMEAVKAFQGDNRLEATGVMDADTLRRIFKGDPNVKVIVPE